MLFVGKNAVAFASDRSDPSGSQVTGEVQQTVLYSTTTAIQIRDNGSGQRLVWALSAPFSGGVQVFRLSPKRRSSLLVDRIY